MTIGEARARIEGAHCAGDGYWLKKACLALLDDANSRTRFKLSGDSDLHWIFCNEDAQSRFEKALTPQGGHPPHLAGDEEMTHEDD